MRNEEQKVVSLRSCQLFNTLILSIQRRCMWEWRRWYRMLHSNICTRQRHKLYVCVVQKLVLFISETCARIFFFKYKLKRSNGCRWLSQRRRWLAICCCILVPTLYLSLMYALMLYSRMIITKILDLKNAPPRTRSLSFVRRTKCKTRVIYSNNSKQKRQHFTLN